MSDQTEEQDGSQSMPKPTESKAEKPEPSQETVPAAALEANRVDQHLTQKSTEDTDSRSSPNLHGRSTVPTRMVVTQRPARMVGALAILAAAALLTIYLLAPFLAEVGNPYWYLEPGDRAFRIGRRAEQIRNLTLAFSVVVFGTLASAAYLRTGRVPSLRHVRSALLGSDDSSSREVSPEGELNPVPRSSQIQAGASKTPPITRIQLQGPDPGVPSGSAPLERIQGPHRLPTLAEAIDTMMLEVVTRLHRQIPELTKRANLNLTLGIFFALGGMAALTWAAVSVASSLSASHDWKMVIASSLPRVSLALIVELFSYFFLGLYRTTLSEIKYFENEITTAQLRVLALRAAAGSSDAEATRAVFVECARTERNFRLAKDESTVELEQEKLNNSLANKVLERVGDALTK